MLAGVGGEGVSPPPAPPPGVFYHPYPNGLAAATEALHGGLCPASATSPPASALAAGGLRGALPYGPGQGRWRPTTPDEMPDCTVRGGSVAGDICTLTLFLPRTRALTTSRMEIKDRPIPSAGRSRPRQVPAGLFVPFTSTDFRGEGPGRQRDERAPLQVNWRNVGSA